VAKKKIGVTRLGTTGRENHQKRKTEKRQQLGKKKSESTAKKGGVTAEKPPKQRLSNNVRKQGQRTKKKGQWGQKEERGYERRGPRKKSLVGKAGMEKGF